LTAHFPFDVFL